MDALLGRQTLAGLAANDDGMESRRFEVKLGYGVPAFGARFTTTPELGVGISDTGREARLGWRLSFAWSDAASFELGLEAGGEAPEHGVGLELGVRF